jgi:hypothetical protein
MKMYKRTVVMPKRDFQPKSFRTIPAGHKGAKLVIGRLARGKHEGKTRVQEILTKRK